MPPAALRCGSREAGTALNPVETDAVEIVEGLEALDPPLDGSVLTVGNFDGVHRAHQQLLAQAGLLAADRNLPVVVLTFEPHPLRVVAPRRAPQRLTPLEERLRLLGLAGADLVVVARSEPTLLELEPEPFVTDILLRRFRPRHIVEGPSFGFGRRRRGTPEMLRELAAPHGCEVHILPPVTLQVDDGEDLLVSSSMIRALLSEGKVRKASLCLGRPYALFGRVVEGAGRGRAIGFPTVNLHIDDQLIPADGVYAGRAFADDVSRPAAINIGPAPTFQDDTPRVEAHLLDFHGDLYGGRIRLEIVRRLREAKPFSDAEALTEQLRQDVERVRELLS